MEIRTQFVIILAVFGMGLAAGKYSLPAKVVTKIETVTVEKEVIKYRESSTENTKNNKVKITKEDIGLDGKIHREITEMDKSETDKSLNKASDKTNESLITAKNETAVIRPKNWDVSGMAGIKAGEVPHYGALIQTSFGPAKVGVYGLTNVSGGFTFGLSF